MKEISETKVMYESSNTVKIFKGLISSFIITLVLLFIFAVLLTYTNIQEATIGPVIIGITGISILAGSSMTTNSIRKNGIINGGIIGFIYIAFIYLVSAIAGSGFVLNIYSIIMMIVGIIAGAIGGIVRSKFEVKNC